MPEPMAPAGIDDPIAGLLDIPLPAAISLWPETWVSRIVVAIAAAAIGAGVWALLARWFANRYRRAALAELDDIARRTGRAPFASVPALAVLVRRTALAAFPRSTISALDGDAWLGFLDASYGGRGFSEGPGRALGVAVYSQRPLPPEQVGALTDLIRRWIRTHHV
jgi:Domain of unknown function (DUF4381)